MDETDGMSPWDTTKRSTEPQDDTSEHGSDDGPINIIRFAAWGTSALSIGAMIIVVLNDFCTAGTAAGFIWPYSGLFAFVSLLGLALATRSERERNAAFIVMGVGTSLGAVVGLFSGFASLYPGGC